jgi:hypothetical protein
MTHYATTSNTTPVTKGLKKASLKVPGTDRDLSKSSGATTPLALDSVFCSTSESSDNEGNGLKTRMGTGSTARPVSTRASRAARPSLPVEFNRASLSKSPTYPSKSPSYLSSKQYAQRKQSQSPVSSVAAAIASSSSSRSREDIISWAKAVKSRPGDADTSEDEARGRSRTRKQEATTNDDIIEEEPLSTTPKGPLQSVFSGLTIGRLGPIVKALTSVTGNSAGPSTTTTQPTSALGLHAVPAPATVSRVDVTASSGGNGVEDNQLFFGGATPTLSTISFSEANEPPSIATDIIDHDHVDMATDDQSAISSHYRRGSAQAKYQYSSAVVPKPKEKSSTSMIWNIPSYIRSFAPFSIINPPHPTSSKSTTAKTTPSTSTSTGVSEPMTTKVTTPLPASRVQSPIASPGKVARSIPLDIKMPVGLAAHESRIQERQAAEYLEQLARSRRSKSRRESRSRSRSRGRAVGLGRGRSPTLEPGHARMVSYDADQSGTEAEDEEPSADMGRRGRSHRSKNLGPDIVVDEPSPRIPIGSLSATRSDDIRQSRSRGRRESPIGRGRDRGRDRTVRG